jgi:hypothetical protein
MASSRMPRLKLGSQRVPQLVRVHAGDAGGTADAVNDAADDIPVQRAAVVGDQPVVTADVLKIGRGPGGEQLCQLCPWLDVAWHGLVPVVAGSPSGPPVSLAPLTSSKHERQPRNPLPPPS